MTSKSLCKRIEIMADGRGEFTTMDDGYVYWFPSGFGGLDAATLRALADILDTRNAEWDKMVKS